MIAATDVKAFVNKNIKEICNLGFDDQNKNHCAHFVSHVLDIQYATLCGDLKINTGRRGATIRVNELFNNLSKRGLWNMRPSSTSPLLVFVTSAKNVLNNRMSDHPQKHVGILVGGRVYNYSNGLHRVAADSSVESFHSRFKANYHGDDISLYYGVVPC